MNNLQLKTCSCGLQYDIGTNYDTCPKCRYEKLNGGEGDGEKPI